jgi:hypothetical protein
VPVLGCVQQTFIHLTSNQNRKKSNLLFKENIVAHKQQGNLTKSPQWWKHLKDWKRVWHKQERQAHKKIIRGQ